MNPQPSLFGALNPYGAYEPPLARRTDPKSSHRAAERQVSKGKVNTGVEIILAILKRAQRPLTYRELWAAGSDEDREKLREPSTIAKRLPTMERRGLVRAGPERLCSVGQMKAREWELCQ